MKTIPLRVYIIAIFVSLLVSSIGFIVYYSYHRSSSSMLKQAENLVSIISNKGVAKTITFLRPATISAKLSAKLISKGVLSFDNPEQIKILAIEMLKEYPQFAMFNFGDKQGNYLSVAKKTNGEWIIKLIKRNTTPATVTIVKQNGLGNIIKKSVSEKILYDPRVRPWYQKCVKTKQVSWTDLYIFFTSKQPGITVSVPIKNDTGEVTSVIGIDIDLHQISNFLRKNIITPNSIPFVINNSNDIIAYPNIKKSIKIEGDSCRLLKIDELNNSTISLAYKLYKTQHKAKFYFKNKGQNYLASFKEFPRIIKNNWTFVIVVPENDFTSSLKRANEVSLIIATAILILGIFIISLISKMISEPISMLTAETERIKQFNFNTSLNNSSYITEIKQITTGINSMKLGLRAFEKYVPAALVKELVSNSDEAGLGGESREITLFFSDIENFTTISETLEPSKLMQQLTIYFSEITSIITEYNGTVDKFIGDSVMAFWGAPIKKLNHIELACRAALTCRDKIRQLNRDWEKTGIIPFPTRIGLHSGKAIVGNIGSSDRMNYTALGDVVNLASRLEGLNKIYKTEIIVSETIKQRTENIFTFRYLDKVQVKGRSNETSIYELVDIL